MSLCYESCSSVSCTYVVNGQSPIACLRKRTVTVQDKAVTKISDTFSTLISVTVKQ